MESNVKAKTLQQVIRYFSDEQTCIDAVASMRWPDGKPTCPACGHQDHYYLATQRRWKCKECYKQFSVKLGTIFEDSPLPLDKWLCAMWLIGNCKNGISSCEVAKDLGITQKSAWFMMHRIRCAMQDGSLMKVGGNGGEVEVDETFIGGKARNMHVDKRERRITGTGGKDKVAVFGALERGGRVRVAVVPSRRKSVLQDKVREHVAAGSALYSDALKSYDGLAEEYAHKVIDHAEKYVDGKVHTNGLENFWSLLKRGINGTYVSVEPFHLFRYLDEQAYRFNNRKEPMDDSARFYDLLSRVGGRRLTYAALTGKLEAGASPA
jgi:transposase-like protein